MEPYGSLESAVRALLDQHEWVALAVLALSSVVEYVFPPFPGDTVTLAGAVLVTGFGWAFLPVFAAVTLGSIAGSAVAFAAGQWLYRRGFLSPTEGSRAKAARGTLLRLVGRFERHGEAYLIVNRFLPGIRALFFVAAGLAHMRPSRVLFYSAVSATLWNLAIMALGLAIGSNLGAIERIASSWSLVMGVVIGAVILYVTVRWLLRRRRSR